MSDDEDDLDESDPGIYDTGLDGHDTGGFGPLIPTETERSLMERVREELKNELKFPTDSTVLPAAEPEFMSFGNE